MHHLLNFILGIEALRPRRSDDEFIADWKGKQREVVMSILGMVAAVIFGFIASSVFDSLALNPILAGAVEPVREPVGYLVLAAVGLLLLRTCVAFWDLFRFAKTGWSD